MCLIFLVDGNEALERGRKIAKREKKTVGNLQEVDWSGRLLEILERDMGRI